MRRFALAHLILIVCLPTLAQERPQVELSNRPWAGDWMQARLDQMVSGEDFLGYPGPLVKMYYAFGQDQQHPGTDHDRLALVLRDSPFWYGTCNGWASAAITYDEPDTVVINGVKLFAGEVKAILARIWKDTLETQLAGFGGAGLTAEEFHTFLYNYIGQDQPLVFDVTIGEENWNYPVAGYTPVETQDGDWTNVKMTVFYTDTRALTELIENPTYYRYFPLEYYYRYSNTEPRVFEWQPGQAGPDRAWQAGLPYIPGTWLMLSNRYWDLSDFDRLHELAADETDYWKDRFEPNQDMESAAMTDGSLAMGAVAATDADWFQYEKNEGEPLSITLDVYDGPPILVSVHDAAGNLLSDFGAASQLDILIPDHVEGPVQLALLPASQEGTSFYNLQRARTYSWFRAPPQDSRLSSGLLRAVNTEDINANLGGATHQVIPGYGAVSFRGVDSDTAYRSDQATVFALEKVIDNGIWKRYINGHAKNVGYEVPHITCRNGWETILEVKPSLVEDLTASVFDTNGALLETITIPSTVLRQPFDLGHMLSAGAKERAAWFKLETSPENNLTGYVTFRHPTGYRADYDISSHPRNGVQYLTNLPAPGAGWVGLSLLNTSGVENEVLFRLYDDRGSLIENGIITLAPGERRLGLPQQLFSNPIGEDYHIAFFSQYNLESLALRHHPKEGFDYAHRLDGEVLDALNEGAITVPSYDHDTTGYLLSNINNQVNWVLFEGYSESGELIVSIRPNRRALRPFESLYITLPELLATADITGEDHGISWFKITTQRPLVMHELVGDVGRPNKTMVSPAPIYRYP